MSDSMAMVDLNFVGVRRGTWAQRLKNRQKPTIFAVFGLGCLTVRLIARPPVGRSGRNFKW